MRIEDDGARVTAPPRAAVTCVVERMPDEDPGGSATWENQGATYRNGVLRCSDGTVRVGAFCIANCPAGAGVLALPIAADALDALRVPLPRARLSPSLEAVRSSNLGGYLVGVPMYAAVDPADWRPITARADVAGFWVEVTATPRRLEVEIDDDVLRCDGPGEVVTADNYRTTSSTCRHVFERRGTATVRMRIVYAHTYSANFATNLPAGETGEGPTAVVEIPVVETQPVLQTPA